MLCTVQQGTCIQQHVKLAPLPVRSLSDLCIDNDYFVGVFLLAGPPPPFYIGLGQREAQVNHELLFSHA